MEGLANYSTVSILMTTDTVGGVWSYSVELCRALLPFGVHFYLITTGAPMQASQKEEVETLENVTVYETGFLLEWMENPWESIDASGNWLLQLEDELQPDLIHINGYAYGSLPWKAPVIVVAHSDVFSWWLDVKGVYPPAEWNEYYKRISEGINGADYLIAPSRWMLQAVKEIYGATVPGKVIYNGRSAADFYPAQKGSFVFSMGRIWDEAKNIQLLVNAAMAVHHIIQLAGDNHFAHNNTATDGTNISYLGKLPTKQIAVQLAAASIYVLPAKYEPFGLSVLEAALSGCALVLGNIDSLKEIWSSSAIYVDTNDVQVLADTVNNLMRNEDLRNRYAQAAMKQALKYSTTVMAANYLQVYTQLLASSPALLLTEKGASLYHSMHQRATDC